MNIDIEINKERTRVMINSSVTKNFMTTQYAKYRKLLMRKKTVSYSLTTIDKSALNEEKIDEEVEVQLLIDELRKKITFDIMKMINHSVILEFS